MNPNFFLFLDDLREPSFLQGISQLEGLDWTVARTVDEAKELIKVNGYPIVISFDHDLGDYTETGYDFVKWLIEEDLGNSWIAPTFRYFVHSMNPVGADNINKTLSRYLEKK